MVSGGELAVLRICAAPTLDDYTQGLEIFFKACARKGWIAPDWFGYWWPTAAGYVILSGARRG